ncbi:MAG: sulfatase [Armatimonadetes bacterium]|nr:sulfatase [Armatimonadota bacterium]
MKPRLTRRRFLNVATKSVTLGGVAVTLGSSPLLARTARERKPNVLFIAVDDLRPTLGCYGSPIVQTPNIDRLARRGMIFSRAYCQQAVCAPSRNSLLTGRRPDTIGIYDLATHFRARLPHVVTLPQQLKSHGYHAEGLGKIYHTGHGNYDDVHSWSVPSWPKGMQGPIPAPYGSAFRPYEKADANSLDSLFHLAADSPPPPLATVPSATPKPAPPAPLKGPPTGDPDVPDNALFDGKLADRAVERLRDLAKDPSRPFFLAVGFLKPHLPFIAPKKYWDLYDPAKFELEPVRTLPEDAPPYAGNGSGELRTYEGVPQKGPIPDAMARNLIHGYHASVSYVDAQIGRVLDELDRLGLRDSTIIVLWGDHGFHLGDHGLWAKHTNFERAAHSPLLVSAPGMKAAGRKTDALTEFVDIYPTLCDLAGIPKPDGLEGTSFAPLLDTPRLPWKSAAFHLYPRNIPGQGPGMGRSIRTDRYRLTEWTANRNPAYSKIELYDYAKDPGETVNLAEQPGHEKTVKELKERLHDGWRAALPPRRSMKSMRSRR